MTPRRHRWSAPTRFVRKSERICLNGCGIVKVSRHEGDSHWLEFWRAGERVATRRTPVCAPATDPGDHARHDEKLQAGGGTLVSDGHGFEHLAEAEDWS